MLHSLSKIPNDDLLQKCLNIMALQEKSALLLYQDAVYLAIAGAKYNNQLNALAEKLVIYVIEEDLLARGLKNKLINNINIINYSQFVELVIQHDKTISW